MLCLDLIFAAAFNAVSEILVEGLDHLHYFFALFLPIMWLWQHFNYLFNRFDPGEIAKCKT